MGKKAQTGRELYGKQQQNEMEGIKSRQHNLTGNITCINLNLNIHPKKLRLPIQTLNILRLNVTYSNQIIQDQENVKNHCMD